jgi:phage tail sheath protein FI
MSTYTTPGVYIEEITGPGAIAGVSTSNAAFVGPALAGPLDTPTLITSYDEFVRTFGARRDGRPWPYLFNGNTPYYMAFAIEGFFANGGQYAYVVRVGTARASQLDLDDAGGGNVAILRALQDGVAGDGITIAVEEGAAQQLVTGTANITPGSLNATQTQFDVDRPTAFLVGDVVQDNTGARAAIKSITGATIVVDASLSATPTSIRIADVQAPQREFRVRGTYGLRPGGDAILDDGANSETVTIVSVASDTRRVVLQSAPTSSYDVTTATIEPIATFATASGTAGNLAGPQLTLGAGEGADFRVGDRVSDGTSTATVVAIAGDVLTVDQDVTAWNTAIVLADFTAADARFRVENAQGLYPGTIAELRGGGNTDVVSILSVTPGGVIEVDDAIARANDYAPAGGVTLHTLEFRIVVTPPAAAPPGSPPPERHEGLSLNEFHPRFLFNVGTVASEWISVARPDTPPTTAGANALRVTTFGATTLTGGADDNPSAVAAPDYQRGLDALADVDEVNLVVVPDAAASPDQQTIQSAMTTHCLNLADRFAILDSGRGMPPTGAGSVLDQRGQVETERGFAALYYPWLQIRDPRSTGPQPRRLLVPPSGHVAGIYARTDQNPGVHKAPANTNVRGVSGLERRLSNRQQGPLNSAGVNVLRIFPGSGVVNVWGARTTVDPVVTDWLYVPVRRLLLYLEESIQEGIRWAIFAPSDLTLWKQLERTITAFLTSVWQDGALFGATADEAFRVRIDEALNPPSERALGRLYIEIKVAPVRPAEFIIVRIGLWDGGGDVNEA